MGCIRSVWIWYRACSICDCGCRLDFG
uniref:Uncharacterized protein n=1 Tax=Oryza glumipatula TaxID=40148 RepID=A0A0E0B8Q5_9ORYZ